MYPGGGTGDAGCGAAKSSAVLQAAVAAAPRQRAEGARAAGKCRGWGRLRPRCPPAASQQRAGEAAGVGARGSGQVRVPARRVLPSDPGESLALCERSLLLGHWRMRMERVPFRGVVRSGRIK